MYTNFAYIYDNLMYDVDYSGWADYIERIFRKYDKKPELALDLGCGTGSMCIELCRRGYDMIGIDISSDMLACAREKSSDQGMDILYLNQDMREFELYGTVDAILCLMDSINYITSKRDVKKVFKLVKNYLNPEGIFVFDINSEYKLANVLGNNVFYDVDEEITYIWQNSYKKKTGICEFDLTFFVKEDELYRKYEEQHRERAYSIEELRGMVEENGFEVLGIYDNLSFKKADKSSERIFFVCKNI